jgi:hypothetical protein
MLSFSDFHVISQGSFEYNNTINSGDSVTINKTVVSVDYEVGHIHIRAVSTSLSQVSGENLSIPTSRSGFGFFSQVTIRTGDVIGGGTDGQVYLSLSGDNGKADEVLVSSDPESTARGKSFVFTFNGLDVGDNRSLTLRLVSNCNGQS